MKFFELQQLLGGEVVFRTTLLLSGKVSPTVIRRQLDRWVRSGKIVMLRRGVYAICPPFTQKKLHPFALANAMRHASYVSLQSALAYYGMIPEHVPVVTSVSTNRPESLENSLGRFIFRHVKKDMFFGYVEKEVAPLEKVRLALPEKALVDLLYLTPHSDHPVFIDELRLEPVSALDQTKVEDVVECCGSLKVERAWRVLLAKWRDFEKDIVL